MSGGPVTDGRTLVSRERNGRREMILRLRVPANTVTVFMRAAERRGISYARLFRTVLREARDDFLAEEVEG